MKAFCDVTRAELFFECMPRRAALQAGEKFAFGGSIGDVPHFRFGLGPGVQRLMRRRMTCKERTS